LQQEKGNISIHTENILPIIKKWLYSDRDIFIRELITNGVDAVSKLKRLNNLGEAQLPEDTAYFVRVEVDKEHKLLRFIDNGIGMTAEEIKKYINQIAFSGAEDFIARFKDQPDEGSQIIGHFGLGFYSAFMVAEEVEIDTLSYQAGAEAVTWRCTGGTEFEIQPSNRTERGTAITLHIAEDSQDFLDVYKVREIITKYCAFLPVEIFLTDLGAAAAVKSEGVETVAPDEAEEEAKEAARPLNNTSPLWLKDPKECTDEEYKEFYQQVFFDFQEPLFWIHLNVDYPFDLKGILYFPRIRHEFDRLEGKIKLYNNQVFVADNIKEVIPEFLLLLKGVLDCKDLPLNVSRSFLQHDSNVMKISRHITKKVGDKLAELFNGDRDKYNSYWDDINPFVKYGCMREDKFYERVKDILIFKTTDGTYLTLAEYLEQNKEKHANQVFYVSDEKQQAQYVNLFREQGMAAVLLPAAIDMHFVQFLESKNSGVKFSRIDADLSANLKGETEIPAETGEALSRIFTAALEESKLKIETAHLKAKDLPAMILLGEQSRRMQDMSAMFGNPEMAKMFPGEETLILNGDNELVQLVLKLEGKPERQEDLDMIARQIYDLALLSHRQLEPAAMTEFIRRSNRILTILAEEKAE